jgi:hypothetical protein
MGKAPSLVKANWRTNRIPFGGNPVANPPKTTHLTPTLSVKSEYFGSKNKGVAEGMGFEPTIRG